MTTQTTNKEEVKQLEAAFAFIKSPFIEKMQRDCDEKKTLSEVFEMEQNEFEEHRKWVHDNLFYFMSTQNMSAVLIKILENSQSFDIFLLKWLILNRIVKEMERRVDVRNSFESLLSTILKNE